MMRVLVTGGTGFVGSAVVRRFVETGYRVRTLQREARDLPLPPSVQARLETAFGDLTDLTSLRRALAGCSGLVHVAADYRLWHPDPNRVYRVNVEGTRALMHAALDAGVERILYTSSVATLGLPADGGIGDETTPVTLADMVGHYKRSKYLAEETVRKLTAESGLPALIVNPSTTVGPRDRRPTPSGRMILDAAAGRMPAYVDTGLNIAHVDDVADGHLRAFECGRIGERYVLGGENLPLREILARIAALTGHRPPWLRLPNRPLVPLAYAVEGWSLLSGREPRLTVDGLRMARKHMYFSSDRAERELGYRARPADEAFADAIRWYRQHGYLGHA